MYNNKDKRDILIFPKFKNMNLIQEVLNKIEEFKDFDYQFTTVIDEISIELIGDKEESILIGSIKLKGKN